MKSNKFNASWQLARVQAKKIKDVFLKVEHVMLYFTKNTNIHDQDRVLNWLATTAMAYRDSATKEIFINPKKELTQNYITGRFG